MEIDRMGRCARKAWDDAVDSYRAAEVGRPGLTTGHILLGVVMEGTCAGGLILRQVGVDLVLAQATTEWLLTYSRPVEGVDRAPIMLDDVPLTHQARRALAISEEEADLFAPTYPIGTEHLLLALLRIPESLGYRTLRHLGIDEATIRGKRDALWKVLRSPE